MPRFRACLLALALACASAGQAMAAPGDYPPLREARDPGLQAYVDQQIDRLGLRRAVREKRLAVTLVDMTDPQDPHMAGVNGNVMMYSASLPKIAILLGAFQRIEDGDMQLTADLRRDLVRMIRYSSNAAATRVLDQVGRDYLLRQLQSDRYRLYDRRFGGGLWVGKPYSGDPAYRRDPLHGISHGATTIQAARFYYLLETGRLVSPEASREMKAILSRPGLQHKFVAGIRRQYPEAGIYRKSGTWRSYHSDSAIIEHDGRRYIAVALANDPRGGEWLPRLIVALDEAIFEMDLEPAQTD